MIKASDISQARSDKAKRERAAAEAKIDRALQENGGDTVDLHGVVSSKDTLEVIANDYREAGGWAVEVSYGDQRDPGPFLKFSIQRNPR